VADRRALSFGEVMSGYNTKSLTVDHKLNGNVCGELHPTCTLHTSSEISPFAKFYFKYGYIFDIFIYENIDKNFDKLEI
jgi:hypothetical protein